MNPNRPRMNLDFGTGTLSVVAHDGKEFHSFRAMCAFVGADYAQRLAAARDDWSAESLADGPGGEVLFEMGMFPMWLFTLDENDIAAEHREGHRAFVKSILDSRILEPVALRFLQHLAE